MERFEMVGVVELLHAALVYQTRPNHQSAFLSQQSSHPAQKSRSLLKTKGLPSDSLGNAQ